MMLAAADKKMVVTETKEKVRIARVFTNFTWHITSQTTTTTTEWDSQLFLPVPVK